MSKPILALCVALCVTACLIFAPVPTRADSMMIDTLTFLDLASFAPVQSATLSATTRANSILGFSALALASANGQPGDDTASSRRRSKRSSPDDSDASLNLAASRKSDDLDESAENDSKEGREGSRASFGLAFGGMLAFNPGLDNDLANAFGSPEHAGPLAGAAPSASSRSGPRAKVTDSLPTPTPEPPPGNLLFSAALLAGFLALLRSSGRNRFRNP